MTKPGESATFDEAQRAKQRAYNAKYRATHKRTDRSTPRAQKNYRLKCDYGITLDDFESMAAEQGGRCAICGHFAPLHVDHDHVTGEVRGLLCFHCNCGIGHLRDDPVVIAAALAYLSN